MRCSGDMLEVGHGPNAASVIAVPTLRTVSPFSYAQGLPTLTKIRERLSFDGSYSADLLLQQQHTIEQRLCRRRTAGHINVHRDDAIATTDDRVGIVVIAAAIGA